MITSQCAQMSTQQKRNFLNHSQFFIKSRDRLQKQNIDTSGGTPKEHSDSFEFIKSLLVSENVSLQEISVNFPIDMGFYSEVLVAQSLEEMLYRLGIGARSVYFVPRGATFDKQGIDLFLKTKVSDRYLGIQVKSSENALLEFIENKGNKGRSFIPCLRPVTRATPEQVFQQLIFQLKTIDSKVCSIMF